MQTDNSTRAYDLKKSDVWKKPPQNIKKRTKKFRFRDFSRDVFEKKNIEDTLGSNFIYENSVGTNTYEYREKESVKPESSEVNVAKRTAERRTGVYKLDSRSGN